MIKKILNKRNIVILSLVLLVILALVGTYYIDLSIFNSKLKTLDGKYVIKVSHLIGDKDELDSNATIDDTTKNHLDSILYYGSQYVPLTKDGDYLYADLDDFTNDILLNEVTDIAYAKNNAFGETIEGCSYDKETRVLKVPLSYYEDSNRDQYIPIQVEIESLLTKKQISNVKTDYSVKKYVTNKKQASNELLELDTKISLQDYVKNNISLDKIQIYINNSDLAVPKEHLNYDTKSRIVTIDYPSILINKLDIKIGNNFFDTAFAYWNPVEVDPESSSFYTWELTSTPSSSLSEGSSWSITETLQGFGSGYDSDDNFIRCADAANDECFESSGWTSLYTNPWQYYRDDSHWYQDSNYEKNNGERLDPDKYYKGVHPELMPYIVKASAVGSSRLSFTYGYRYISLHCTNLSTEAASDSTTATITMTVVERNNSARYMIIRVYASFPGSDQDGIAFIKVEWPDTPDNPPDTPPVTPPDTPGGSTCHARFRKFLTSSDPDDDGLYYAKFAQFRDSNCTTYARGSGTFSLNFEETFLKSRDGESSPMISFNTEGNNTYVKEISLQKANLPEGIEYDYCQVVSRGELCGGCNSYFPDKNPGGCNVGGSSSGNDIISGGGGAGSGSDNEGGLTTGQSAYERMCDADAVQKSNTCEAHYATKCFYRTGDVPSPDYRAAGYYGWTYSDGVDGFHNENMQNHLEINFHQKLTPVYSEEYGGFIFYGCGTADFWENGASLLYTPGIGGETAEICTDAYMLNNEALGAYIGPVMTLGPNILEDYETSIRTYDGALVSNCSEIPCSEDNNNCPNNVLYGSTNYVMDNTQTRETEYCYSLKKVDDKNNVVAGAKFKMVNTEDSTDVHTVTTDANGIARFNNLKKADYTLTEVSAPNGYWNDNTTPVTVSKTDLVEGSTCSVKKTVTDKKKYYCMKIRKVDEDGNTITSSNAKFKVEHGNTVVIADSTNNTNASTANGITSFFFTENGQYKVTEIEAPTDYKVTGTARTLGAKGLKEYASEQAAREACLNTNNSAISDDGTTTIANLTYNANNSNNYIFENETIVSVINWYKTVENGTTKKNGAEFKVKNSSGQYLTVSAPVEIKDRSNPQITKSCYVYTGTSSTGSVITTGAGGLTGEACISKLPAGTYTVEETKPLQYHTFGSSKTINLTAGKTFAGMTNSNKFINIPTNFEFTKSVTSGDGTVSLNVTGPDGTNGSISLTNLTTKELQKLKFVVTESGSNTPLSFVYVTDHYEYVGNSLDAPSGTQTTTLQLNSNRKLVIKHLEWGKTYDIKEAQTDGCLDAGNRVCNGYGFYYPNYSSASDSQFTITNVYNSTATKGLSNTPTQITFTKNDLYGYLNPDDVVKFENQEEINAFDQITFKLKDANGNYLTLQKVGNTGSCNVEGSYSEYRYVPSDQSAGTQGTELHTCGGKIVITHLCRETTYKIEEVAVPSGTVFTLTTPHPEVTYNIPKNAPATGSSSVTQIISDTPTRVKFEKIDSKYGYLINDPTTTFKAYQCNKNVECHPSQYSTDEERAASGIKVLNFVGPAVISNDNEDPGIKVYKYSPNNESNSSTTQELHPYNGMVVLRYLPADNNYQYVLLETKAPNNYLLPTGVQAENEFTVVSTTVEVDEINVPNAPTALIIKKYADLDGDGQADEGKLLGGAKFKVYKVNNYNANLSLYNQEKQLLSFKTIKEGIYENRPVLDTSVITTCKGNNCSYIPSDTVSNTISSSISSMLKEGMALVQYLDYDAYYIIEEVEAPEGYSLPENIDNRLTLVHIKRNETAIVDTGEELVNKPTTFTFYKFDEYNTPLDGATFYLQKLDNDKKYNTLTLSKETTSDGKVLYRADENSELTDITTVGGKATVYYLEPGQYRILEVEAPEGYELPKKTINVATFFVDEDGLVFGNNIITNKKPQETIEYLANSQAELIINIQTGKKVIKYGLIITVLIAAIVGLVLFLKKRK